MNILISKKKEIEEILQSNPPKFPGYKKDKLLYLVSKIYYDSLCKEEYGLGDNEGINLNAKYLEKIIGKSYKSHLNYLLDNGIISIVSGYIPGNYSRSYKLNDNYFGVPEWYEIKSYILSKNLKNLKKSEKKDNQYLYLKKWLNKLTLDIEHADVTTNLSFELKKSCPEYQEIIFGTNRPKNPDRQYYHSKMVIELFKNDDYPFYVDDKGYRAHTILTRSNKSIRHFIKCNGEDLVSVDLKNSQPYLLLCLGNPSMLEKSKKKEGKPNQTQPTHQPIISIPALSPIHISSIMFGFSSGIQYSIEFQEYKKLVSSGCIYEFFEDKIKIDPKELKKGISKRDIVKHRMMLCLYSKNSGYSGGMKTAFKKHFPKLYALICKLKAEKHNTLALLLQRIESYLILDVICKRISEEKPDLPIFTIHDCIVTTVGNEQYVSNIIIEEMEKFVGIAPRVSFDYWHPKIEWKKFEKIDEELSKNAA